VKNNLFYNSYEGNEPYIFLRFDKVDRQSASGIVNLLIEREFRVCYHEHDRRVLADAEGLADRILSSSLAVFLLSKDSLQSLESRNCINFALNRKKQVFCIFLDDEKLEYGFDMQLATVPGIKRIGYENINALCDDMLKTDCFSQELRGEDAKSVRKSNRKRAVVLGVMASILVLFLVSAAAIVMNRMQYENSAAGQVSKLMVTDYLDLSSQDASLVELLRDKTITTLVLRNMGLTDLSALVSVRCEELDLSENPAINTLEPLLDNMHLKTVRVTQDMVPAIIRISGRHPFTIIITE
jgi:hypothetical protein